MSCPEVILSANDYDERSRAVRLSKKRTKEASDNLCMANEDEYIMVDFTVKT